MSGRSIHELIRLIADTEATLRGTPRGSLLHAEYTLRLHSYRLRLKDLCRRVEEGNDAAS